MTGRPTNDTPCADRSCMHKLGEHYKRYDGKTGCAGFTGQQDEFHCSCTGFSVVYDPSVTAYSDDNDMRR